ncbi:ent-kaurene synthase [Diaporthe helianthi]|uniref:Ent-kaurene synthase n=1 Tax=Diaporthe helianthi TaxID=158607 RepID=A0A2P5HRS2_DIAHE|nr:ent-kaurene synthase [Diaporthe helianthi]
MIYGKRNLADEAISLLQRATDGFDDEYGSGSMGCAVYDTAWVSLVAKGTGDEKHWLFPECFSYLLDSQLDDGSWGSNPRSQIDGILNTGAALLALKRHQSDPMQINDNDTRAARENLAGRIDNATRSLRSQMLAWDVTATRHVGYEIIVPALLRYLQHEDDTLVFEFPGKAALKALTDAKLARFKPEYLYGSNKSTVLHSLEVLIGMVDFDKLSHHKTHGSMMASPSSTAAYLMNTSQWHQDSEDYLRRVLASCPGLGSGGVPSAYPSMHFEYTWVLSTLLRSGLAVSDLECTGLRKMEQVVIRGLENGNGAILSMTLLGHPVGPEKMLETFEADKHFRTYNKERDPSFTANCNVLAALLCQPDPDQYALQVLKAVSFLCDHWWSSDGRIADKWNLSHLYPNLLLVEDLTDLMALLDRGGFKGLFDQQLQSKILIASFQACLRTMLEQNPDGSWADSIEETAYGILILSEARKLSTFVSLRQTIDSAIQLGAAYIRARAGSTQPEVPIWIEKVSYTSTVLTDCYAIAALKVSEAAGEETSLVGTSLFSGDGTWHSSGRKHVKLLKQTPLFSDTPQWQLEASMVESVLFQPLLRARRLDIFPRKDMADDKYFDIIPLTWTSCNNRCGTFASTSFIYEMMVISFLNYQADEFMEASAGAVFCGRTDALSQMIDVVFSTAQPEGDIGGPERNGSHENDSGYESVLTTLSRFVAHVSNHPAVQAASPWDRESVRRELRTFLQAHVVQNKDNSSFQKQLNHSGPNGGGAVQAYAAATDTFFHWVRTTSADHTSCPYSFSFVSCLLSAFLVNGRECFPLVGEKYLAAAACRHLATMCRMYNDYGSIVRDAAEGNVNSINFPEYHEPRGGSVTIDEQKRALFDLAQYERACLDDALRRLWDVPRSTGDMAVDGIKDRQMAIWKMFCDVTDLYGQIYVVRDIASRMKVPGPGLDGVSHPKSLPGTAVAT